MTSSLAVRMKEEDSATGCTTLADLVTTVDACVEMNGEVLGEYIERNWDTVAGNALGLMHLVIEMQRKFSLLDRKKQVNGEYLTIRGFRSFKVWFAKVTGKSERLAYYLLETEKKKNERNTERRTREKKEKAKGTNFAVRCNDTKKALAEIHRQENAHSKQNPVDLKSLEKEVNASVYEAFYEFLSLISPEGCEVSQGDNGKFYLMTEARDGT